MSDPASPLVCFESTFWSSVPFRLHSWSRSLLPFFSASFTLLQFDSSAHALGFSPGLLQDLTCPMPASSHGKSSGQHRSSLPDLSLPTLGQWVLFRLDSILFLLHRDKSPSFLSRVLLFTPDLFFESKRILHRLDPDSSLFSSIHDRPSTIDPTKPRILWDPNNQTGPDILHKEHSSSSRPNKLALPCLVLKTV